MNSVIFSSCLKGSLSFSKRGRIGGWGSFFGAVLKVSLSVPKTGRGLGPGIPSLVRIPKTWTVVTLRAQNKSNARIAVLA